MHICQVTKLFNALEEQELEKASETNELIDEANQDARIKGGFS